MRIESRPMPPSHKLDARRQIDRLFARGPLPAPVCAPGCGDFDPAIGCQRDCAAAVRRLSSDPSNHPVERRVAPLVFELKKLGVFHPCWSCEGHNDRAGSLWKIPRVWFCAESLFHVRVLSHSLDGANIRRHLSTPWHVVVTGFDLAGTDTVFSLEPDMPPHGSTLDVLHGDLAVLSAGLDDEFWQACDRIRRRL